MASRRYEISLREKCFTSKRSERAKYFSTQEEKLRFFKRSFNLLFITYTLFFHKNIFYKNIDADICEILRIF